MYKLTVVYENRNDIFVDDNLAKLENIASSRYFFGKAIGFVIEFVQDGEIVNKLGFVPEKTPEWRGISNV